MTTNAVAALCAGISAAAAVATAVIAAYALFGSRSDSRARSRPVIIAQLRAGILTRGSQFLVIKNYGQSIARNVHVEFDPELPESDDEPQLVFIRQRYASPITIIAPGQALGNVYVAAPGKRRVPEELLVKVSYMDDNERTYCEKFVLRPQILGLESTSTPSDSNDRELRQIKAIEAVARAIEKS